MVRSTTELPRYRRLLSHGPSAILQLPEPSKQRIAVLELDDPSCFAVISLPTEQGGTLWFSLVEQCRRKGLSFHGFYTCDEHLFGELVGRTSTAISGNFNEAGNIENHDDLIKDSGSVQWFREQVALCVKLGASDIHIEIRQSQATLRIRADGIVRAVHALSADQALRSIASCYTLLAEERSRSDVAFSQYSAQAAMIPMSLGSRQYLLRFQSHPAVGGLDVVFRILKNDLRSSANVPSVLDLGYTDDQARLFEEALSTNTGGIFIAGITGSGKTTTLTSLLTRLAVDGRRKIITIEDTVEYQIQGVTHFSVQRSNDSDNPFEQAMMAFLRMDPDVGMLGEIRDKLSGQMAYTAIQTGHKLLTTVHATSALGIVSRLCGPQIGMNRHDICSPDFVSLLVYQLLVPLNCKHCCVPSTSVLPADRLQKYLRYFGLHPESFRSASKDGCEHCRPPHLQPSSAGHNGIKGMKVAAEVIRPDMTLLSFMRDGEDLKAMQYWRQLNKSGEFGDSVMMGKPAWGHSLYDVSRGLLDPYYFEHIFGSLDLLVGH